MNKRPPRNGETVQKNTNTLLVDGNALFKTGFFGAKNAFNHKGEHIGGLYQFLTIVRKLLNENLFHRVYVFWDGKFSGKLRYNIYAPYKSGRGKDYINGTHTTDESELKQKGKVWDYLDDLYIRQIQHNFVESDDFIGYYCLTRSENENITICTNDRDMCQLISENVRIYFCDLKEYVDMTNYSSYFRHHQENAALIKTIIGDNSDTIKGVKGVKETTLLSLFPEITERKVTLDEIIEKAKVLRDQRIESKKKPLKVLDNLINGTTDGVQGDRLYEINTALVDLKNPMMTEDAIQELDDLKEGEFNTTNRGIKNVLVKMKQDGLERTMGSDRYSEYLIPFKQLIEREFKKTII
jgi:5'-3' exonuclease